jgi:HEAT repeat protein
MSSTMNHQPASERDPDVGAILDRIAQGSRDTDDLSDLSDPTREQFAIVRGRWDSLPLDARRFIVRQIMRQGRDNLGLNFQRLLRLALRDGDAEVRALAIAGLWEDTSESLVDELCDASGREPDPVVQEAIASALDRFSLMASTGDLDEARAERIRQALLGLLEADRRWMVRRKALEAVSYFSDDDTVNQHIENAARSTNEQIQAGALTAMGRNLDPRWFATVLAELANEEPDVRCEAARAAGQYEDERAIPGLIELLSDEDDEIRCVAVESLGSISGRHAIDALKELQQHAPDDLRETIDRALSEAEFLSEHQDDLP